MTGAPAPVAGEVSEGGRWRAFGVCVAVAALTILDLSKVNVGLPSIEGSLHASSSQLQLIVAGYALAFGLALVPSGRLGDVYSRKAFFLLGLSLFTLASVACALAPGIGVLVVARLAQGIAAGIQMPQVLGLVQQLFQGPARARAFGLFGATVGVSTALGPTLGGLLIAVGGAQDGWRLLFWMNVPLGLIALGFAWRLLPGRPERSGRRVPLDLVGIALVGSAVVAFMLPFVLTTGEPGDDPRRWLWLAVAAAAAIAFVLWERSYARRGLLPVVDFGLFRRSSYRNGILIAATYFAALPASFLISTLYLQQGLGLEPVFAGMVTISFALASAAMAWIGGRLVQRVGRALVVGGLCTVAVGIALVLAAATLPPPAAAPWAMAGAMTVTGLGGGLVISPNQTLTLAEVPVEEAGVAGSLTQVGQRVGNAVGVAAATAVYFSAIYGESGGRHVSLAVYHDAYRDGFFVCLGLVLLALVFAVLDLLARRRRGSA